MTEQTDLKSRAAYALKKAGEAEYFGFPREAERWRGKASELLRKMDPFPPLKSQPEINREQRWDDLKALARTAVEVVGIFAGLAIALALLGAGK